MKNIAYGILLVIFLSILVEPMVEVMEIGREHIKLGTALSNACKASTLNVNYQQHRDLNAEVNEADFMDSFADVFATALGVTYQSRDRNTLWFDAPDYSNFNDLAVQVTLEPLYDAATEQTVTRVNLVATTKYKFKTKYLKMVAGPGVDFDLRSEKIHLLYVKN